MKKLLNLDGAVCFSLFLFFLLVPVTKSISYIGLLLLPLIFLYYILKKHGITILVKKTITSFLFWIYLYVIINNLVHGVAFGDKEVELKLLAYFLLSISMYYFLLNNIISMKNLMIIFLTAVAIHAFSGYWQLVFGQDLFLQRTLNGHHVRGAVENQNVFGFIMLLGAMCTTYLVYLYERDSKKIVFYVLAIISLLFLIVQTGSRNPLASYFLYVGLLILFSAKINKTRALNNGIGISILTLLFVALRWRDIVSYFNPFSENIDSGRFQIWSEFLEGASSYFWTGNGLSSPYYLNWGKVWYPHNLTIEIFYSFGLIGIFIVLYLLLIFLKKLKNMSLENKIIVLPSFITLFMFYLQFGPSLFIHSVVAPFIFVYLGVLSYFLEVSNNSLLNNHFATEKKVK